MGGISATGWGLVGLAYLVGAVPFGLLLARRAGVDVRAAGSGNIGAANVARTVGKASGLATLALDAAKGALPVLLAGPGLGGPVELQVAAGAAAVLGHVFPVYLRFRGGKGVATAAGVFVAASPVVTALALAAFVAAFAVTRRVSVGSILAALALALAAAVVDRRAPLVALAAAVALLVIVRHRANLGRLRRGEEPRLR